MVIDHCVPAGSPFGVHISDEVNPNKVKAYGPGLDPKGVRSGQPAQFTVDATEAGEAPLEVTTTDQLGKCCHLLATDDINPLKPIGLPDKYHADFDTCDNYLGNKHDQNQRPTGIIWFYM